MNPYHIEDVVHEEGSYWVLRFPKKPGYYEVYRIDSTHSTRVARCGGKYSDGLERAKAEVKRRICMGKQS